MEPRKAEVGGLDLTVEAIRLGFQSLDSFSLFAPFKASLLFLLGLNRELIVSSFFGKVTRGPKRRRRPRAKVALEERKCPLQSSERRFAEQFAVGKLFRHCWHKTGHDKTLKRRLQFAHVFNPTDTCSNIKSSTRQVEKVASILN